MRDLLKGDEGLQENFNCGPAVSPGGGLEKGERAGAKRESGAEHKACGLIGDKKVVCERLSASCGKSLSDGELVVWSLRGTGRR